MGSVVRSLQTPFRLNSLDEIPAPQGCHGTWQRYVIAQGDNKIVGMRQGKRTEVTALLAAYVERLNVRFSKSARGVKRRQCG